MSSVMSSGTPSAAPSTGAKSSFFDKLAAKTEAFCTFYVERRELLWRPYFNFCIIMNLLSLVFTLRPLLTLAALGSEESSFLYQNVIDLLPFTLFYHFGVTAFCLVLALAAKSRLAKQASAGITLAALFIFISLIGGHLISVMLSLYVFMNEKFRAHVATWAPGWYQSMVSSIYGLGGETEVKAMPPQPNEPAKTV